MPRILRASNTTSNHIFTFPKPARKRKLTHPNITRARKEFTILVKRTSHDPIGGIEGFFDSIAVVDVYVDVEHARVVPEEFEDTENDICE